MACKALLAAIKHYGLPCSHVNGIWELGNLFALTTGCQALCDHAIANCNFLCRFPQKINGEANREDCRLLPPAERLPLILSDKELLAKGN